MATLGAQGAGKRCQTMLVGLACALCATSSRWRLTLHACPQPFFSCCWTNSVCTRASAALTIGTVYRVGIHQKKGTGGNAVLEVYLATGDAAFGSPFASSMVESFTTQATRLSLGATNSNAIDATFDDIRLDSATMP